MTTIEYLKANGLTIRACYNQGCQLCGDILLAFELCHASYSPARQARLEDLVKTHQVEDHAHEAL